MASTPPLSSSSTPPVLTAMDSAALHPCPKCHRRVSSLKYDSHSVCTHCRDTVCCVDTRCSECKDWTLDIMQEYLSIRSLLLQREERSRLLLLLLLVS